MKDITNMTPEELNEYLIRESERIIQEAEPGQRAKLQGLQWKCDAIREMYKDNPQRASIEMSKLMWMKFIEMNEALHGRSNTVSNTSSAEIKEFRKPDEFPEDIL